MLPRRMNLLNPPLVFTNVCTVHNGGVNIKNHHACPCPDAPAGIYGSIRGEFNYHILFLPVDPFLSGQSFRSSVDAGLLRIAMHLFDVGEGRVRLPKGDALGAPYYSAQTCSN